MSPYGYPQLLAAAPLSHRQLWARWILGTHSDVFLPEMSDRVEGLNRVDPIELGQPFSAPGLRRDDLLVIAASEGRHCVIADAPLACRVVLFDWTGRGVPVEANPHGFEVVSVATECKGHLIEEAVHRLGLPPEGCFAGFVDDDVVLRFSDVVSLLAVARIHRLSAVQPAVTLNSSLCNEYPWLRQRTSLLLHRVPVVEIMAPFIRSDLLSCSLPFLRGVRSGYGFDRFALPLCAEHLGDWRFAVVDSCPMSHARPLSSVHRRFSNGLLSKEEELLIRQRLMLAMGFDVDPDVYTRLEAAIESAPGRLV